MLVFNRKVLRTNDEFGGSAKIACCRKQVRILSCNPESHEPSHRQTRNSTMFAVCDRIIMSVDVFNQLGKVKWKLAISLDRTNVVGTNVILFIRASVITIRFHDDHVMGSNKVRNVVSLVFITFIKISIVIAAAEKTLRPSVIKIDNRVSLQGVSSIRRW